MLARIPDPNDPKTFEASKPAANPGDAGQREVFYRKLLAIRSAEIVPRLQGARSLDATAVGAASVVARWRMNDAAELVVACNLGAATTTLSPLSGKLLFATSESAARAVMVGSMDPFSTVALLSLA
jgi:maltooligosyltrehalose trehalohydrolase